MRFSKSQLTDLLRGNAFRLKIKSEIVRRID